MDPQLRDKLLADAKTFRRIARLLQAIGQDDGEEAKAAQWLLAYADQLQNEACGMAAPAVPYDRDVRADYADKDDVNYGD